MMSWERRPLRWAMKPTPHESFSCAGCQSPCAWGQPNGDVCGVNMDMEWTGWRMRMAYRPRTTKQAGTAVSDKRIRAVCMPQIHSNQTRTGRNSRARRGAISQFLISVENVLAHFHGFRLGFPADGPSHTSLGDPEVSGNQLSRISGFDETHTKPRRHEDSGHGLIPSGASRLRVRKPGSSRKRKLKSEIRS